MNTPTAIPSPRQLPPPAVLLNHRLLSENCSATLPMPPDDLTQAPLILRATTVTVVLDEFLAPSGYRHGGIND